jgi:hypothetical protein
VHTLTAQIISAVTGAMATAILAVLAGTLRAIRRDIRKFMAEHLWLLAIAGWSVRSVNQMARELGIDIEPPPEWKDRHS